MTQEIINRTTANGTKWEIVFDGFIAALYMNGHFSGYTFRSIEEAQAHLDAIDERVRSPRIVESHIDCSDFYGRGSHIYYGD